MGVKKIFFLVFCWIFIAVLTAGVYAPVAGLFKFEMNPVRTSDEKILPDIKPVVTEQTNPQQTGEASLLFVGDIMLSRTIGQIISIERDPNYPFAKVADFLKGFDLVFGNLETPISLRGTKIGTIYSFRSDPATVAGLKNAGFGVLNLANNHAWDYGPEAFSDTMTILHSAGIDYVGGGLDHEVAHTPVLKNINGLKIAFLGYTNLTSHLLDVPESRPALSYLDTKMLVRDIQKAKQEADLVVVTFHWGDEYQTKHNLEQESIAHLAIDNGASLVIGHHPHVVQDVEKYKDGYIAYSLGNFVFDQNFSPETAHGLGLEVKIKDKNIESVQSQFFNFNPNFQPVLAE